LLFGGAGRARALGLGRADHRGVAAAGYRVAANGRNPGGARCADLPVCGGPGGGGGRRRRRAGRAASNSGTSCIGRARASPSRFGSCSSRSSVPSARTTVVVRGAGLFRASPTVAGFPHLIDERVYRPLERISLGGARQARRLQSGKIGTYAAYLIALVLVPALRLRGWERSDERGLLLRPARGRARRRNCCWLRCFPGLIQHWKARLQGAPAARVRSSPTVSLTGSGARARSRSREQRSFTGSRRRSSPPAWWRRSCSSRRPRRGPNLGVRSGPTRACGGCSRSARFALHRGLLGYGERVCADGCEPRPDSLGVRRGQPDPGGHGAGADRGHDRAPPRSSPLPRGTGPLVETRGFALAAAGFRARRDRRDRPPTRRQPPTPISS